VTSAATVQINYATGATFWHQGIAYPYPASSQGIYYQQETPYSYQPSNQWIHLGSETPEQKADREKRAHEREVAASRADLLLMDFLSDAQADQYKKENRFELRINGRTYRINRGRSGNVQLIENGKPVAKYCAHPGRGHNACPVVDAQDG
jgi:hypothetical protein